MLAVAGILSFAPLAMAQVTMWTGGGADDNWNTSANWSAGSPNNANAATQQIDFSGSTRLTPTMTHNYSVNAVEFDSAAGAFDITQANNTLTLDGTPPAILQQSASNQAISGGTLDFSVGSTVDVSGAGSLIISSVLSGAGSLIFGARNRDWEMPPFQLRNNLNSR